MTKRFLAFLLAAALPVLASAQGHTLDKIRKKGEIALGYVDGALPFSWAAAGGEPQGYSVALCRAIADGVGAQLKLADLKVRWVRLTIQNRLEAVRKGEVDLECSTTTWTLSRQQQVDFSLVTFVDGASLLLRAGPGAVSLADFDGRRIGVIGGTTTEKALGAALARRSIKAEVVPLKTRLDGLAAVGEGKVDAFASDRTALIGMLASSGVQRGTFRLLDQDFAIEQYAFALPRNDHDWRLAVNRVLARIYRSGEIEKIYNRWLGPLGPPSVLLSATYFIQGVAE